MTTLLEQQLMDSIEISKRDQLIRLLTHENSLIKKECDQLKHDIARMQRQMIHFELSADDLPALLRRQI